MEKHWKSGTEEHDGVSHDRKYANKRKKLKANQKRNKRNSDGGNLLTEAEGIKDKY